MQNKIKALQAELLATKEELVKVKLERAAAFKQVEVVQAQASIDIESVQKKAAEQLALSKLALIMIPVLYWFPHLSTHSGIL